MLNCTPDVSHKEQIPQIIRYIKTADTEILIKDFIHSKKSRYWIGK